MEGLLESFCDLDPRPIVVSVPVAALLEVLYLVSQDPNLFAQPLDLLFVFEHESVGMDLLVDRKFVVRLDYLAISELEPIHAEGKHLRWFDDPVCLSGVAFSSLVDLVPFNGISKCVFPGDVKVFLVSDLEYNIADCRVLPFLVRVPILVCVLDLGVRFANEGGIDCL